MSPEEKTGWLFVTLVLQVVVLAVVVINFILTVIK